MIEVVEMSRSFQDYKLTKECNYNVNLKVVQQQHFLILIYLQRIEE